MSDKHESISGIDTNIDAVLKRLNNRAEEGLARLVYTGKALSKSDTHLHLAVSSGIVLVPIAEIDSIAQVYRGFNDDYLHVAVKNADRVTHVLRREQLRESGGPESGASDANTPLDLSHFDHSTITDIIIADACDATDVHFLPQIFGAMS